MKETQVLSLGQENSLEKGMASYSNILACGLMSNFHCNRKRIMRFSAQDSVFHHLQSYIWHVKERDSNPTAAAIWGLKKKKNSPEGFMQNILNIPFEQNDLTDFFFKGDASICIL